jgi:hypothetical protein
MKRLAALTLVLLAACSSGGGNLAKTDPKGAEACSELAAAFKNKDNTDEAVAGSMRAGAAAVDAKTDAIRAAVIDLGGDKAADPEKMHDACVAAGVSMPDVPSS